MFPFLGTFPKSVAYHTHRRNLHIENERGRARLACGKGGFEREKKSEIHF